MRAIKRYVLTVEGGIHADLHGPFDTRQERSDAYDTLSATQDTETDGIFLLNVTIDGDDVKVELF
jgi:hypothetical protein